MPIDYTIPLKAGQGQQTNPLQSALQAAQFRMASLNSQALQQGIDANNAASQAFKESTDANGNTDYNKFRSIMASGAGAYNLPQINNSILEAQQKQQTLDTGKLEQSIKTQAGLRQGLGSLMQKPDLSPNDVLGFMSTQLQAGAITPQVVAAEMQSMPQDPGQLRQWLTQHYQSALQGETQMRAILPQPTQIDTGGAKVYVDTNPMTNPGIVGTQIAKTVSPETAIGQVPTYQNGQPGTKPVAQVAQEQGLGGLIPGGAPAQAGGNGRYPGAAPAQPPAAGGFNPTAAPMGAQGVADEAGKRFGTLQSSANTAKTMMQTYDLAADAVSKAMPGKGGAVALNVPALLNTFGIQAGSDTVKNNQLLVNYLNSAADQAAAALGLSGSDSRLAAAKAGQPDAEHMNAPALLSSIQHVKGLQQAVLDRSNATNAYLASNGNNTGTLPQFENQWNKAFNPDVSYIRSLPTPQAQQAEMQKLKASGRLQQVMKDYQAMKALGAF